MRWRRPVPHTLSSIHSFASLAATRSLPPTNFLTSTLPVTINASLSWALVSSHEAESWATWFDGHRGCCSCSSLLLYTAGRLGRGASFWALNITLLIYLLNGGGAATGAGHACRMRWTASTWWGRSGSRLLLFFDGRFSYLRQLINSLPLQSWSRFNGGVRASDVTVFHRSYCSDLARTEELRGSLLSVRQLLRHFSQYHGWSDGVCCRL